MAKINSGARCCPGCGCDEFNKAISQQERADQGGYRIACLGHDCDWKGFTLQLSKKPGADAGLLDELAKTMHVQAGKSFKPGPPDPALKMKPPKL